jgi:hypothetical protein
MTPHMQSKEEQAMTCEAENVIYKKKPRSKSARNKDGIIAASQR